MKEIRFGQIRQTPKLQSEISEGLQSTRHRSPVCSCSCYCCCCF